MFFKKKIVQKQVKQNNTSKQDNTSNDFTQEKRLYEFRENMKKLSKDENSAKLLARQLSRLIQKSK
ncbi:TPA: molybdenum cofactor biosynthesis protein [Campylobacter lari subsp. concheus]|uniref:molybdenum cofactor biosynthesis protein n=1 Tax=Campylobacter TaxID=194 RepID=UPI000B403784|nr:MULTISPECIES: molybdenum cofactor biosynthesis protein [Campylobacter]EAJ6151627.1 molybdenum cofactor biosynthesis protein [Campylobacter lari]EHZ4885524.1 molybdenum cofactor biosynthesis protein [Campylobacter lari]MBT0816360.1 molybdenum cofactor biosynthesis protein [Campylobacter lari]MBT0828864.1 molybdenum cofactor biosynthesis protein [Campylobacter lari]MCV3551935.1 molybdenum cofactor biosynthesis protein [Campylobacter sp. CNRCH_2013_0855]